MFIKTLKKFLSEDKCRNIIDEYSKMDSKTGTVLGDLNERKLLKVRKSSVLFANIESVKQKLETFLDKELNEYTLKPIEKFQFTKYETNGHYDWHSDIGEGFKNRFCTVVIQLNNEYLGGELLYKDTNQNEVTFENGVGNLFIFSSSTMHKVKPVTNGVRYSLVNWISLNNVKNINKSII